jgi:crotonobetainyl-CoA:carnitine CoA-transferase CaiB-like acyl-CoA transferase
VFPCLAPDEFVSDPQVQHLSVVIDSMGNGPSRDLRPPWQMASTPASVRRGAPRLDEHRSEITEQILSARKWVVASAPGGTEGA